MSKRDVPFDPGPDWEQRDPEVDPIVHGERLVYVDDHDLSAALWTRKKTVTADQFRPDHQYTCRNCGNPITGEVTELEWGVSILWRHLDGRDVCPNYDPADGWAAINRVSAGLHPYAEPE